MAKINEGGAAFPWGEDTEYDSGYHFCNEQKGMTLRAYIATHALQGILAAPHDIWPAHVKTLADVQKHICRIADGYALAMIAQLEQQP